MSIPPIARQAMELARSGDMAGAIEAARKAVESHPHDYGLRLFIATLHSRRMELDEALPHMRKAVSLAPNDPIARVELVRLLIGLGRLNEAEQQLAQARIPGLEPIRLQAMIFARREQPGQAAQMFRQVVAADPRDHESWGNLGSCLLASGQSRPAIEAFDRAVQLRPDLQKFREKLMEAKVEAGLGEEALAAARKFALDSGKVPGSLVFVARLEDLLGRPERSVDVLRDVLADHPDHLPALVALAGLLERNNRVAEFGETIARIEHLEPSAAELPLLRARLAFREGDLERGLELAEAAPEMLDRGTRAELIGTIHDRLGNGAAAFRAFEEMNCVSDLSQDVIAKRSQALRAVIDDRVRITTPEWVGGWSAGDDVPKIREPAFLIGFPRSGTTLLDTFLMGHPDICIAEEKPMLQSVSERLGDFRRLAVLEADELRDLRDRYFRTAAEQVGEFGDRLLIDKYPLGAIDAALIHCLFPTAKIVFTQRHPCDVVLSCFFTRFQPTPTLTSFHTLEDTAKLYDKVMSLWQQCRVAMPLDVHELKYEELVGSPDTKMRQLVTFLGLDWDERVSDHQKVAGGRDFVRTASYAQVVEPLYKRSIGRWKRYAEQLAPVLPILLPWAERMGYES
jgi:Tfp pilus assembly protein PilF